MKPLLLTHWSRICLYTTWLIAAGLPLRLVWAQDTVAVNLGPNVNSRYEDILPVITSDGGRLYFVRKDHPNNYREQDVWYADYDPGTKTWKAAQHLDQAFNSGTINGIYSITPDGNTLLVRGATAADGTFDETGFSLRTRTATGWGAPKALQIDGLKQMARGLYLGATLAPGGRVVILYLSEEELSDKGDLYVSFVKEDGTWARPVPLGSGINTTHSEASPFIAADGRTLYFASDRPGGKGNYDIYKSIRQDDTWRRWSAPANLGSPINTAAFDAYYTLPAAGDVAYMVSGSASLGGSDIVQVALTPAQQPLPVTLVGGVLTDAETGAPIEAELIYRRLPDGKEDGVARTNPQDGSYKISLPYGYQYEVVVRAEGYEETSFKLDLRQKGTFQAIQQDLPLKARAVPEAAPEAEGTLLTTVYFETGRIGLLPQTLVELDLLLRMMKKYPGMTVALHGHTDYVGSHERNYQLSVDRANMVRAYLLANGIAAQRVSTIGYGYFFPAARNHTDQGRARNRRVDIHVQRPGLPPAEGQTAN
ncbi:MAG: OmpA family protein [Bacteroidia bacterium]